MVESVTHKHVSRSLVLSLFARVVLAVVNNVLGFVDTVVDIFVVGLVVHRVVGLAVVDVVS